MTLSGGASVGASVYQTNATAGSGTFTIQMTSGQEAVIHNLYWSGACSIKIYDGSNLVTWLTPTAAGSLNDIQIHVVATSYYIQITDTSGSTNNMAVDGIRTL